MNLVFETNVDICDILADYLVHIDPTKMSQVMRNLVSNALKFTPKDKDVTVAVSLHRTKPKGAVRGTAPEEGHFNSIQISVQDEGVGISEVTQSIVYYPF